MLGVAGILTPELGAKLGGITGTAGKVAWCVSGAVLLAFAAAYFFRSISLFLLGATSRRGSSPCSAKDAAWFARSFACWAIALPSLE